MTIVKMENRKLANGKRYIVAFIIATLIFAIGFGMSYFFAYIEFKNSIIAQDAISYKIFQDRLEMDLLNKNICNQTTFSQLSDDLKYQVEIMRLLEGKFGKTNSDVIFRKQFYTLTQFEHFQFIREYNEKCNASVNIVLFFYSNKKENSDISEEFGRILDILYERNKERLVLYSIDMDLNSDIINGLNTKFSIKRPTIIINEKIRFEQINNIDEIEKYLKNETDFS